MFIEDKLYFELAEKVLEKIKGKLNFSISKEERIILAEEILKEITTQENNPHFFQVYQDPRLKKSFLKRFFSYEEIEEFIFDPQVEDIAINGTGPIYVHTTDKGLVKTNKRFKDFKYLNFFLKKILILSGREENKKMIDFELPYIEGRVNIVHSPFGPQITITKIKETPLSIIELIHKGSLNYRVAAFLWLAVEGFGGLRPANILIAGGPGAGKTGVLPSGQRDWSSPGGKYGIAQLSNRLLWAPDGLNLAQSLNGEMLGYGYTPLPLTKPMQQTNGKNIETGNQCWTLFLNATNFKGPATFFLPTFWTEPALTDPSLEGLFLDSRPSEPNIGFGIEHAGSPALISVDEDGNLVIDPTDMDNGSIDNCSIPDLLDFFSLIYLIVE